jgi:CBS domain-containing protein
MYRRISSAVRKLTRLVKENCNFGSNQMITHSLINFNKRDNALDYIDMCTVKEFEYDKPVLTFKVRDSICHFVNQLYENKCSCGLVYDNNTLIGVIDTIDIATYMSRKGWIVDKNDILASCLRKLVYVYDNCSVYDSIQYLKSGFRYIIVKRDESNTVLSQGSLLRNLYENDMLSSRKCTLEASIETLKICDYQTIIYANEEDMVVDAYERMLNNNITSIPILDTMSKCVGVLSMSDIISALNKTDTYDEDMINNLSCSEFNNFVKPNEKLKPIVVDLSQTLDDVLKSIILHKIHHVYVVNNDEQIVGVISYVDIIKLLF